MSYAFEGQQADQVEVLGGLQRGSTSTVLELAILQAGGTRFRPIRITSLTTFVGLAPMIFDQSMTGAFFVPMAVSLGFGVLFATFITLILVPVGCMILDDVQSAFRRLRVLRPADAP